MYAFGSNDSAISNSHELLMLTLASSVTQPLTWEIRRIPQAIALARLQRYSGVGCGSSSLSDNRSDGSVEESERDKESDNYFEQRLFIFLDASTGGTKLESSNLKNRPVNPLSTG
jgi:hypothetical protein